MKKNKHGLSVKRSPDIEYQIRKECGFGCIICGGAIYEYHHIDPEFKDAFEHEVDKIGIVCPTHHAYATRHFWPTEKFITARKNPFCTQNSNKSTFEFGTNPNHDLIIKLGKTKYVNTSTIIEIDGKSILSISKSEEINSPPQLSASFYDTNGFNVANIVNNEWFGNSEAFDIITAAGKIEIRNEINEINLLLLLNGNIIEVKKINLRYLNCVIQGDCNGFNVGTQNTKVSWGYDESEIISSDYGIKVIGDEISFGKRKNNLETDGSQNLMKNQITVSGGHVIIDEREGSLSLGTIKKNDQDICHCGSNLAYMHCCKRNEELIAEYSKDERIINLKNNGQKLTGKPIYFKYEFKPREAIIGTVVHADAVFIIINTARERVPIDYIASRLILINFITKDWYTYYESMENYSEKKFLKDFYDVVNRIFISNQMVKMNFNLKVAHEVSVNDAMFTIESGFNKESNELINSILRVFLESIKNYVEGTFMKGYDIRNFLAIYDERYFKFYSFFNEIINKSNFKLSSDLNLAIYECFIIINNYHGNKFHEMLEKLKDSLNIS